MKRIGYIFLLVFIWFQASCLAQSDPPKREFRAAWIASVASLDWPGNPNMSVTAQKQELIDLLDELKAININAIIFQIRPECDALYDSPYEPWSYWLTGVQGNPPVPYYDPLVFAIEEAHARGMELHAWFNPYRSVRAEGYYSLSPEHVYSEHPEWHFKKGDLIMLDPGIPDVREYVAGVIADVVRRYDIDGVHFDDYFYPYEGTNNSDDQATWDQYKGEFTNRGNWRRENVNKLVGMVADSIQAIKPHVKFGISPFGIWKSGVPPGITGLNAYSAIYCDAPTWMDREYLDYLTPQLYWPFGGGQDYGKLMPWWADDAQINGRHLYPGQALYRQSGWNSNEIPRQIRLNRSTENSLGSVFFRADNFYENPKGVTDSLKNNYYRYPALLPVMDWKDIVPPNEPRDLAYSQNADNGTFSLQWDVPFEAADSDTANWYVVYRFEQAPLIEDLEKPQYILDVINTKSYKPPLPEENKDQYYFLVRAMDHNQNESFASNVITVSPPQEPQLVQPENGAINQSDSTFLTWSLVDQAGSFSVEVADNNDFQNVVYDTQVEDTQTVITGLEGLSTYYWRTKTRNAAGQSEYSESFNFTTGFPRAPQLDFPRTGTVNAPIELTFYWHPADSAASYRYQLATSSFFQQETIVLDTALTDTLLEIKDLESYTRYYWRVSAGNVYGNSNFSSVFALRTVDVTSVFTDSHKPLSFDLDQNYPNPFNPITTIKYSVAKAGYTQLAVYNVLGQKVATLIDQNLSPGRYNINFDASRIGSGIYFYRLVQGNNVQVRKMMVLK